MTVIAALLVVAVAVPSLAEEAVDLESPEAEAWLGEHWYGVFRGESRVGWLQRSLERGTFEEQPAIVRSVRSFVDVAGDGNGVRSEERVVYLAEGLQRMVQIERVGTQHGATTSRRATRRGERFDVLTVRDGKEIDGAVRAVDVTLADELVLERLVVAARRREEGPTGAEASAAGLDLSRMRPTERTLRVTGTAELGESETGYAVAVMRRDGTLSKPLVCDASGVLVRGAMSAGLHVVRMTEAEATADAGRTSVEAALRVPMNARLGDLQTLTELAVSFQLPAEDAPVPFPVTGRQAVEVSAGRVVLRIRPTVDAGEADDDACRAALLATPGADPEHPAIVKAADRALAGTSRRAVQVERLLRFVASRVSYAVVLDEPGAPDVLAAGRGDCSESARLFVALARAAGIPAREVTGLLWMGDDEAAFAWHAWAEVALLGRWRPVDPSAGVMPANAAHVRVDQAARAAGVLDDARLELVDAKR